MLITHQQMLTFLRKKKDVVVTDLMLLYSSCFFVSTCSHTFYHKIVC